MYLSTSVRSWDALLIGGASGTGKSSVGLQLARRFGVGVTPVDDLHAAVSALTPPEQQPVLHYWTTHPEAAKLSAHRILVLHLSVARVLRPALEAVIRDHIEAGVPFILEGDYLLPELLTQLTDIDTDRIRAVFLYEPDEQRIVQNFLSREPEEGEQTGRAHVSWLFGEWLRTECERLEVPLLASRPWETLPNRIAERLD